MEDFLVDSLEQYLSTGELPEEFPSTKSNFIRQANQCALNSRGVLLREGRIVVRESEQWRIYEQFHDHSGRDATWQKNNDRFWWRGGWIYVSKRVAECVACAHKNEKIWPAFVPPLKPIPITPKIFWRVTPFFPAHC